MLISFLSGRLEDFDSAVQYFEKAMSLAKILEDDATEAAIIKAMEEVKSKILGDLKEEEEGEGESEGNKAESNSEGKGDTSEEQGSEEKGEKEDTSEEQESEAQEEGRGVVEKGNEESQSEDTN